MHFLNLSQEKRDQSPRTNLPSPVISPSAQPIRKEIPSLNDTAPNIGFGGGSFSAYENFDVEKNIIGKFKEENT